MPISEESRRKMGWRKGRLFTAYWKFCEVCGTRFKTVPSSSKQHTCSSKCMGIKRRKQTEKGQCEFCGKIFTVKRKQQRFCDRSCSVKSYKRKPNFRKILIATMPRSKMKECAKCGYKKYPDILERHHINGNRKDNTKKNIQVLCPNCHDEIHFLEQTGRWGNRRRLKREGT